MPKGGAMSKLIIGLAAFVLLAAGGALAGGAISDDASSGFTTTGTTTNETTTAETQTTPTVDTTTGEDISGPCDEAEHANDPRCAGVAPGATGTVGTTTGEDISGPCDEQSMRTTRAAPASPRPTTVTTTTA